MDKKITYNNVYPRLFRSPIFNHPRSFWNNCYGLKFDSHPAGKLVIFGIPKSGNVWLQGLLTDYFSMPAIEPIYDINLSGIGISHLPFCDLIANRDDFIHGVCIIRDIRDIVASYWAYSNTKSFLKARPEFHYKTIESFYYEWFLSRVVSAHKIFSHSEEYAELGVPIIKYEALLINPIAELERLIKVWGLPVFNHKLTNVAKNNNINLLKKKGKLLNINVRTDHFRKGIKGSYKKELPRKIILDIENRFENLLKRWGYF